jgi:hypothetical protein
MSEFRRIRAFFAGVVDLPQALIREAFNTPLDCWMVEDV